MAGTGSSSSASAPSTGPSQSSSQAPPPPPASSSSSNVVPPPGPSSSSSAQVASSSALSSSASSSSVLSSSSSSSISIAPLPPTSSARIETITSDGTVLTVTSVVAFTPSGLPAPSSTSTPVPFLKNKAALAGTFTAAGLVLLVVLVIFGTSLLRRRRARAFDYEVEQAAAEAAKAGHYDDFDPGYGGGPTSDTTHGTYAQPPMPMPHEAYGMRQMAPFDPYDRGISPGAAGVGAASASMNRQKSTRDPYHAFAAPPEPAYYPDRGNALLAAAGLDDHATHGAGAFPRRSAAAAVVERGLSIARSPSQQPLIEEGLHRNRSITLEREYVGPGMPVAQPQQAYASHYQPQAAGGYDGGGYRPSSSVYEEEDAYGGYEDHAPPQDVQPSHIQEESEPSPVTPDFGDYGAHRRLRVANE